MIPGYKGALRRLLRATDQILGKELTKGGFQFSPGIVFPLGSKEKAWVVGLTGITTPEIPAIMQQEVPEAFLRESRLSGPANQLSEIGLICALHRQSVRGQKEETQWKDDVSKQGGGNGK